MSWESFFKWLMKWEGETITNDPRDPGGMTAYGISRRFHPLWPGWALIDEGVTWSSSSRPLVTPWSMSAHPGHSG